MSEITLHINGKQYAGWKEATINRGLDVVASAFSLSVSERWEDGMEERPINPGDACVIKVDGLPAIDGFVDSVSPSFDGSSHSLSVAGRSKSGDLVDCSADYSPGEWQNIKFARLVALLAKPFGITTITDTTAGELLPLVKVQHGETAWELIERTQKKIGVVVNDDYRGGLIIRRPTKTKRAAVALVQGENITSASGSKDWSDRFSQYRVKGQLYGDDLLGAEGSAATIEALVFDRNVKRYRPTVIVAEGASTQKDSKTRASFAMTTAAAKSQSATITVPGWFQNPGAKVPALWEPDLLVQVFSPWLKMDGREMMVSRVSMAKNEGGEITTLELMPPEAFGVLPELKEQNGWAQLLKNTK